MKPSETTAGRAWLGNFEHGDVLTATSLIDGIHFVGLTEMRSGLERLLEQLVGSMAFRTPAVVVPERGLEDLGVPDELRASAVAYEDFHPGADLDVTPGSEGFVGGLLRDLPGVGDSEGGPTSWISPEATLDQLHERRCRSIVIVTDYIGSGNRVLSLAAAFARNPRIRSWRSFGWTDIHVAAFAASPDAFERLQDSKLLAGVWTYEAGPTINGAPWSSEDRDAVIDLCHTKCLIGERKALGYRQSAGLFVSQRGAPNNLPAVLWQTTPGWVPLFQNRSVPAAFADELGGSYRAVEDLEPLAERIGQLRIGRNRRLADMRPTNRSLLRVLVLLGKGHRGTVALAQELSVEVERAEALVECLGRLGWIDDAGAVTELGRDEIAANKQGLRRTTAELTGSGDAYYPHSLRWGG